MIRLIPTLLLLLTFYPAHCSVAETPGEATFQKLIHRDAVVIPLWPGNGTPPNAVQPGEARKASDETVQNSKNGRPGIRNVSTPSMIFVSPPVGQPTTGTTILFAPGGGYGSLSLPNAVDICDWAGAIGANCAVLKYRVPKAPNDPGRQIPLSDAQRAVRLLRAESTKLGVDPNKIIVIGSSAGGHLAFNLSNNHRESTYEPIDAADQSSARPDATVLMYPAYLTQPIASLDADTHLHLDQLSPDRTSPVFITVTRPDKFTWGAVNTMLQLAKAKVPAELHVYPEGGHGGCFDKYPLMEFVRPAARFLKDQGLFSESMERQSNAFVDQLESTFLNRGDDRAKVASNDSGRGEASTTLTAGELTAGESDWTSGDRKLAVLRQPKPEIISLWPGDGRRDDDPGAEFEEELPQRPDGLVRITNVSRPTLHLWRPNQADGRAVIVFPGGAYNALAAQHEGTDIAAWLNEQGITAFVAKYRVPRREGLEKHAVALQDAQRAIALVRSRAAEFGIDPQQIGVLGFSAGGNLAALTVHQSAKRSYQADDVIDQTATRPNFAILVYPAYMVAEGRVAGTDGSALDPLIEPLRSRNDYPPIYLAVAADDRFAPDSLHYLLHLHQVKVPGELHVYASGGHGKGLRESGGPFAQWTRSCRRWLDDLKYGTVHHVIEESR